MKIKPTISGLNPKPIIAAIPKSIDYFGPFSNIVNSEAMHKDSKRKHAKLENRFL